MKTIILSALLLSVLCPVHTHAQGVEIIDDSGCDFQYLIPQTVDEWVEDHTCTREECRKYYRTDEDGYAECMTTARLRENYRKHCAGLRTNEDKALCLANLVD